MIGQPIKNTNEKYSRVYAETLSFCRLCKKEIDVIEPIMVPNTNIDHAICIACFEQYIEMKFEPLSGAIMEKEKESFSQQDFINLRISQTDKRPGIILHQQEKACTILCNDDLWSLFLEWSDKGIQNFNVISLGKLYFQLKQIFEKRKEMDNEKETRD